MKVGGCEQIYASASEIMFVFVYARAWVHVLYISSRGYKEQWNTITYQSLNRTFHFRFRYPHDKRSNSSTHVSEEAGVWVAYGMCVWHGTVICVGENSVWIDHRASLVGVLTCDITIRVCKDLSPLACLPRHGLDNRDDWKYKTFVVQGVRIMRLGWGDT